MRAQLDPLCIQLQTYSVSQKVALPKTIQTYRPKLVYAYEYIWTIAVVIFSYTGSPQVKISQKRFRVATFLTHIV